MIRALLLALISVPALISGCTTRGVALSSRDAAGLDAGDPVSDCMRALDPAFEGARCEGIMRCTLPSGVCCVDEVVCEGGVVRRLERLCEPRCIECAFDRDCPPTATCEGGRCQDCASVDPDGECAPCASGFERLVRNGCVRCDCFPVSACSVADECGPEMSCIRGFVCGARDSCGPAAGSCCSNSCGAASCAFPSPLGCAMGCPPEIEGECGGRCAAVGCTCDGMVWACVAVCAPADYPFECGI